MAEYCFNQVPLSKGVIRKCVKEIFRGGEVLTLKEIASAVRNYHISNGGSDCKAKNYNREVSKALNDLKKEGLVEHNYYNLWEIINRTSCGTQCPT